MNNQDSKDRVTNTGGPSASAARTAPDRQSFDPASDASSVMSQAKSKATDLYTTATDKASHTIEEQKAGLASGLTHVADSVRQIGDKLRSEDEPAGIARFTADYTGTAAEKIEQVANYFESHDLTAMYHDAESFARRNPMLVIGGAFVAGLLAARVLKSSDPGAGRASTARRINGQSSGTPRLNAVQ